MASEKTSVSASVIMDSGKIGVMVEVKPSFGPWTRHGCTFAADVSLNFIERLLREIQDQCAKPSVAA